MDKLLVTLVICMTTACGGAGGSSDPDVQGPLVECDVVETETNNDPATADLAGVLLPGDFTTVCGRATPNGNFDDWYWFFTPASEYISLVVRSPGYPDIVPEVRIWVNSVEEPENLFLQGNFLGVPGALNVSNWPVAVQNNGFYLQVRGYNGPGMYCVETWSEGWITP